FPSKFKSLRIITGLGLFIICFSSNSCQKEVSIDTSRDSTIVSPPGSVSASFTAKIDGVSFVADKVASATRALNSIAIVGQANDGQTIALVVKDSGVHVYTLAINSSSNAGSYSKENEIAYATN